MTSSEHFCVIGDPIDHSLSPAMQNAAFRAAQIDADYGAVCVVPEELDAWLRSAREHYRGINVTIPHKEAATMLVDRMDDTARRVQALNTIDVRDGRCIGFNTDVPGFSATVEGLKLSLGGAHVVLFGAGGSARAVLWALLGKGARVTIVNRTRARSAALITTLETVATGVHHGCALSEIGSDDDRLAEIVASASLLVNSTPLGMSRVPGSPLPHTASLAHRPAVIDLVYGRETPLCRAAREAGCRVVDGIEMLVQQGAASFRLWTGAEPDLDVMRQACRARLEEQSACYVS